MEPRFAAMAELVDALDSGSSRGNSVDVRVILAAIFFVLLMMRTVIIFANGELTKDAEMEGRLLSGWPVIAVDGGAHHCHALGVSPYAIVGDFDSVSPEVLAYYSFAEKHQFPTEKDETDLELALQFVMKKFQPERIYVYGALGIRTDHLLANLCLLTRFPGLVYMESERESIWALEKEKDNVIATRPNQLLSLFPIGCEALGVTTNGLHWELSNATLDCGFFSVSNRALGDAVRVSFRGGTLVCVVQK